MENNDKLVIIGFEFELFKSQIAFLTIKAGIGLIASIMLASMFLQNPSLSKLNFIENKNLLQNRD